MFDGVDTLLVDVSGLILPRPSVLSQLSPVTRSQCAGQLATGGTGGTRGMGTLGAVERGSMTVIRDDRER